MKRDVRITILKSEVDQKLAEQYAVSGFEACPFHKAGQVFVSDGEHTIRRRTSPAARYMDGR